MHAHRETSAGPPWKTAIKRMKETAMNMKRTANWLSKVVVVALVSAGGLLGISTSANAAEDYGYPGNAMVMVLRVTNQGSSAASVSAFSVHNFKMGSAPNPDTPGAILAS